MVFHQPFLSIIPWGLPIRSAMTDGLPTMTELPGWFGIKKRLLKVGKFLSGIRESNPPPWLGKPMHYRCANPALGLQR